jgi:hypothetical protein
MIPLLAFALIQDAPPAAAPAEESYEEVVIQGRFNFFTLIFDKLPSGGLHNCRVMVSSGNDRIDADACREVPVCTVAADNEKCDLASGGSVSARRKLRGPAPRDLKLPVGR